MKKLVLIATIAITTIASSFAERVDIGGYFSFNVPRSWQVEVDGQRVTEPGKTYTVYRGNSVDFTMGIAVLNGNATDEITYSIYAALTEQDLPDLARYNSPTGWTITKVRKETLNGIPVLYFNEKKNGADVYRLHAQIWIADKHFNILFAYPRRGSESVNAVLSSIECELPFMLPTAQNGQIGDF